MTMHALERAFNLSTPNLSLIGWTAASFLAGAASFLGTPARGAKSSAPEPSKTGDNSPTQNPMNDARDSDDEDLTDPAADSASSSHSTDSTTDSDSDSDSDELKLVLVLRNDLSLSRSQAASHCAQATLANYKACLASPQLRASLKEWEIWGQAKVTLKAKDEDELLELQRKAWEKELVARCVVDSTDEKKPKTVLAIGPGMSISLD